MKLNIGCGSSALDGWINIDRRPFRGVDRVLDVRQGLPFDNVDFIYGEHFLEQLPLVDGLRFLEECRRALAPHGVLRLTTPNLDWVWQTHYGPGAGIAECLNLNRAFHGWGHHFLYNRDTLTRALASAGFATIEYARYGDSRHDALRGIERHPHDQDRGETQSVLVVEAAGGGSAPKPTLMEQAAAAIADMAIE